MLLPKCSKKLGKKSDKASSKKLKKWSKIFGVKKFGRTLNFLVKFAKNGAKFKIERIFGIRFERLNPWSSLDKEESLTCQITSPFNNKLCYF